MEAHSRAGIRYARAVLIAANEIDGVEQLREEIQGLRGLLAESPELDSFLRDPTIGERDKHLALEQVFHGTLSPLMWSFIELLLRKRREALLDEILRVTLSLIEKQQGRMVANVRVTQPLAEEQRDKLQRQLSEITGKQVTVADETDPAITTGFVAQVGDTVYDGSLAAQLKRLRRRLKSADLSAVAR